MILAALLASVSAVTAWLGVSSTSRWLARRDHRCVVRTRSTVCTTCVAVRRGDAVGGHVICACGQVSPHLVGSDLLRWRAEHQGERFPALPGERTAPTRGPAAVLGDVDQAQEEASATLAAGVSEAQRRAIVRARNNPNPLTPQVLREAGVSAPSTAGPAVPLSVAPSAAPSAAPPADGELA